MKKEMEGLNCSRFDYVRFDHDRIEFFFSYFPYGAGTMALVSFAWLFLNFVGVSSEIPSLWLTGVRWGFICCLFVAGVLLLSYRRAVMQKSANSFEMESGIFPFAQHLTEKLDQIDAFEVLWQDQGYSWGTYRWTVDVSTGKMRRLNHLGYTVRLFAKIGSRRHLLFRDSFVSQAKAESDIACLRTAASLLGKHIIEEKPTLTPGLSDGLAPS